MFNIAVFSALIINMTETELVSLYGENIRRIRQSKGLSQDTLSEKAEISSGFLSEIENHRKTGTFDTLAKIAEALCVEPYELLLPQNSAVNLDSRRTKQLMKQLRKNVSETMDTIENFLSAK